MFVHHHPSPSQQVAPVTNPHSDFGFIIKSQNKDGIHGKIVFHYLHQSFEAAIIISATSIQLNSRYPFMGITASSPVLQKEELIEHAYLFNSTLTKKGNQQIVWLMLDLIHLYNLLRLKPSSILELYRATFALVKSQNEQIQFGYIPLSGPIAKAAAVFLANEMKIKHKYIYCNALNLLSSVQAILSGYPQQFLLPKAVLNKLDSILT